MTKPKPKFDVVVLDPPWGADCGQGGSRGAGNHYQTMSLNQIKELPIDELTEDNSWLFLWVTNASLPHAFDLLEGWGFTYRSLITWNKLRLGLGSYYFRNATEHLIFATKGKKYLPDRRLINWYLAPTSKHSQKPKLFLDMINRIAKGQQCLELFAREKTFPHWFYWGNKVESDVILPKFPVPNYSKRAIDLRKEVER